MPDLTLSGLHKRFGSVIAVNGLNIHVPEAQRLVILGPSGCGKSTTLRLIAGLERPDSGTVRLGQQDFGKTAPARRGIGMVFQNAALYPHLSVRENLAFALRSQKLASPTIDARVREVAAAFEISELLERYPDSLSGGQQSRVALARGVVKRSPLLLLDEPLSGLDPPLRWQLQNVCMEWHQRFPTTTVHVTHDQEEAMLMGDLVAVMRAGVIEQIAAPLDVYHHPVNRFVASFIGSPGMNFTTAQLGAGTLRIGQRAIQLPGPQAAGQGMVDAGVRPEAITLVDEGQGDRIPDGRLVIDAVVLSLRPSGARALVRVGWEQNLWWVSGDEAARFRAGQRVQMIIDARHIHCFAAAEQHDHHFD